MLPAFLDEFKRLGGKMVTGIKVRNLNDLPVDEYDAIVNCTGVGAREFAQDEVTKPLRGQVMRRRAPWIKRTVLDDTDDGNYVISK